MVLTGSCVLMLVALYLATRTRQSRLTAMLLASLIFAWGLLTLLFAGSHYFTGEGVTLAVVYHLEVGLDGAGFAEYWQEILLAAVLLAGSILLSAVLVRRLQAGAGHPPRAARVLFPGLVALSLLIHPAAIGLAGVYANRWGWTHNASDGPGVEYVAPSPLPPKGQPPNLLFIYLESLERTYFDEDAFPGLVPNLKRLEGEAHSFSAIHQVLGTEFTIGGMVGGLCGVPLLTASDGNSMPDNNAFLPGARCLGDVLKDQGYRLSYLGGAPLRFAGKGSFYRSHGFERVRGLDELGGKGADQGQRSSWGLYDDRLFELVHDEVQQLHADGGPFGVFTLTLDTHHPQGHETPDCADQRYGEEPMLNAVHCADYLVGRLVDRLRGSAVGERLMIVIASDHLAMRNTQYATLDRMQRRNLLLILPPGSRAGSLDDRPGSTLDVGATVLSAMGLRTPALGYGRDLRGTAPTLVETSPNTKAFLGARAGHVASLWRNPGVQDGFLVDPSSRKVDIGSRQLDLPVMLWVDDALQVQEFVFDRELPQRLPGRISKLPDASRYLLLDRCSSAADLGIDLGAVEDRCRQFCLFAGRVAHRSGLAMPLCEATQFSGAALAAMSYGGSRMSAPESEAWRGRLERLLKTAATDRFALAEHLLESVGPWEVRSSGFGSGASALKTLAAGQVANRLVTKRGLTVFALDEGREPLELARFDPCAKPAADPTPLVDLRASRDPHSRPLLVLAHDSAFCGNRELLERFFAGSGLSEWQKLSFRQPYVALLGDGASRWEWLGTPERSMLVTLDL